MRGLLATTPPRQREPGEAADQGHLHQQAEYAGQTAQAAEQARARQQTEYAGADKAAHNAARQRGAEHAASRSCGSRSRRRPIDASGRGRLIGTRRALKRLTGRRRRGGGRRSAFGAGAAIARAGALAGARLSKRRRKRKNQRSRERQCATARQLVPNHHKILHVAEASNPSWLRFCLHCNIGLIRPARKLGIVRRETAGAPMLRSRIRAVQSDVL